MQGFSTVNLPSPYFSYCALWKKLTMCSLHLRRGSYAISLREDYLYKLSGIHPYGIFALSPLFINVFNHSIISLWIHRYLCYIMGDNPLLLCFIVQIVFWESFQLGPVLLCHTRITVLLWHTLIIVCYCVYGCLCFIVFCFLSILVFLKELQNTPGSSYIVLVSVLELTIS